MLERRKKEKKNVFQRKEFQMLYDNNNNNYCTSRQVNSVVIKWKAINTMNSSEEVN